MEVASSDEQRIPIGPLLERQGLLGILLAESSFVHFLWLHLISIVADGALLHLSDDRLGALVLSAQGVARAMI